MHSNETCCSTSIFWCLWWRCPSSSSPHPTIKLSRKKMSKQLHSNCQFGRSFMRKIQQWIPIKKIRKDSILNVLFLSHRHSYKFIMLCAKDYVYLPVLHVLIITEKALSVTIFFLEYPTSDLQVNTNTLFIEVPGD